MKIFLVGCGKLGKRYAEGIAAIKNIEEFHCYDISEKSTKEALFIFKENREKNKFKMPLIVNQESINKELPNYDFCIVASTAFKRAKLLKDLKEKSNIKYWIIEKVLEQSVKGILEIEQLNLNNAWVNTPRPSTRLWKDLKNILKINNFKSSKIEGSKLNLGSNLIHFLDAYEFILNKKILSIEIDEEVYAKNSMRNGFIELFGKVSLIFENQFFLEIIANESEDFNCEISFYSKNADLISIYNESSLWFNKKLIGNNYKEFRVSEKIGEIILNISNKSHCGLTKLDASLRQHKVFLASLENKKNKFLDAFKSDNQIPIT